MRDDVNEIKTYGLTHVALNVLDPQRSFRFYQQLLGARLLGSLEGRENEDLRDVDVIEFGTPGANDVLVLVRAKDGGTSDTGNLEHFGFRLVSEDDPETVAAAVERAGGTVIGKGRFSGGEPYVFARDPDGYEIELWFEHDARWRSRPDEPSEET